MDVMIVVLPILAAVCYAAVAIRNPAFAGRGLRTGGTGLLRAAPIVVAGFALAGLLQAVEVHGFVSTWLGAASGARGILLATVLGALTPGPVYFVLPLAAGLLKGGAGAGVVVVFPEASTTASTSQ